VIDVARHPAPSPDISVLLATYGRPDTIVRTLESLAAQTLAPARFEVLVIVNGPDETSDTVRAFAERQPQVQVRILSSRRPGVAHARNLGLWAARGDYVTTVDDDDWVSPGFLATLLAHVSPGVMPLGKLADIHDGAEERPDFDNYYSRALVPHEGKTVPAAKLGQAISLNVCKIVPTSAAREVGYDERLHSGSDFVFWTKLFARHPFRFHVVAGDDATYFRTRGHGSLSRQDVSFEFNVAARLDCIESLEDIPVGSRDVEQLVTRMVSAQCSRINRYLTEYPDERPRVVGAVEARRLRRFAWDTVNRGLG
jgi:glycosyltransferase involved in cell wall biosynthesis